MDIRVLNYFLVVAREGNITKAAEALHMSQPPLSRQMKELESELGKKLFNRGNRIITLTEDGIMLRQRAEEIVTLFEKTKRDLESNNQNVSGDIYIGCAETDSIKILAKTIRKFQLVYPNICFHIFSGNADDVSEKLNHGLIDFGIIIEPTDLQKYHFIRLPTSDTWGLLMRNDTPLSLKDHIKSTDLVGIPLICSRQMLAKNELFNWIGNNYQELNIVATYNLLYNASMMVKEGIGYALCIDRIINLSTESNLCFKMLDPKIEVNISFIWKKNQVFSKASKLFLEYFQNDLQQNAEKIPTI